MKNKVDQSRESSNQALPLSSNDHEKFQQLLFNLSAKFINLPADNIDGEIEDGLKLLGEFLSIDRLTLAIFDESRSMLVTSHYYTAPGITRPSANIVNTVIPWFFQQISNGKVAALEDIADELPKIAVKDMEYIKTYGIKSAIAIPLVLDQTNLGCLFFSSIKKMLRLPEELIKQLVIACDILTRALWRKKTWEQIKKRRKFDQFLSEMSSAFIYTPSINIEDQINAYLKKFGTYLDVDFFYMRRLQKDKGGYGIIYHWLKEGINIPKKLWITPKNAPWIFNNLHNNKPCNIYLLDDFPKVAAKDKAMVDKMGIKSFLTVPFKRMDEFEGTIAIGTVVNSRKFSNDLIFQLQLIGEVFSSAILRRQAERKLQKALTQIKQLKEQVEAECSYLREEIKLTHNFNEIIGNSDTLKHTLFKVEQVAKTDATVIILGETGTGKELIARAIHHASNRKGRPLIKLNCTTLPANLIESELFGHKKGAFSGAHAARTGRFELADKATLFLDEIGELPIELQPKLLRVIQEGEFEKIGSSQTIKSDVRVIAATNRDLEKEVKAGRFRKDLWFRLNVFPITVPPLRERKEDIPLLVNFFVNKFSKKIGKQIKSIPKRVMNALNNYDWPGNIRELENILERSVITSRNYSLNIELPRIKEMPFESNYTLDEMERRYIRDILDKSNWTIEGGRGASKKLGLKPSTLRNRMKKLGITRNVAT